MVKEMALMIMKIKDPPSEIHPQWLQEQVRLANLQKMLSIPERYNSTDNYKFNC